MPPRQTTSESSGEVAAATKFERFKELPDELQIMIWAEALPRAAVQYITVSLTSELDSAPRYLHGRYITTMAATRADLSKSIWWQRDNIEQSDGIVEELVRSRFRRAWIYESVTPRARNGGNGRVVAAKVDVAHDIVCIRFAGPNPGGFQEGFLMQRDIMRSQRRLQRFALDLANLAGRDAAAKDRGAFDSPLVCTCSPTWNHTGDVFCPRVLSRWLQQLGHLKTLYVICKLGQLKDLNKQYAKTNCWVTDPRDGTSGRVTSGQKRRKKNATEMLLTVMQIFKGRSLYPFQQFLYICSVRVLTANRLLLVSKIARHEKLEMYEDAQTTFYEVRPQDSGPLAIHGEIWPLLRETIIATQAGDAQANLSREVQYKLLVGCDWKSQALKQAAPGMGG